MSRGRARRHIKPNYIQMFNVDKIKIYILFKEANIAIVIRLISTTENSS